MQQFYKKVYILIKDYQFKLIIKSMRKKILITGGTGLIGTCLTKSLEESGYHTTIFTRNIDSAKRRNPYAFEYVAWDFHKPENWQKYLEDKFAVIHLAGTNLFGKRWNESYKRILYNSRIDSTKNLVKAIENIKNKPKSFITASAVGYYGSRENEILTEDSKPGIDFLAKLTVDWENAASKAETLGVKVISIRNGIVLSTKGDTLKIMIPIFNYFLGASLGSGKQWFPWIHIHDTINIFKFAIENESINGPVNAVSPNYATMNMFVKTLGNILKRPVLFKVPKFLLRIVFGEFSNSILASLKVKPEKLLKNNFQFQYENLENTLKNLIQNKN
jgi:uncharacterized protein